MTECGQRPTKDPCGHCSWCSEVGNLSSPGISEASGLPHLWGPLQPRRLRKITGCLLSQSEMLCLHVACSNCSDRLLPFPVLPIQPSLTRSTQPPLSATERGIAHFWSICICLVLPSSGRCAFRSKLQSIAPCDNGGCDFCNASRTLRVQSTQV